MNDDIEFTVTSHPPLEPVSYRISAKTNWPAKQRANMKYYRSGHLLPKLVIDGVEIEVKRIDTVKFWSTEQVEKKKAGRPGGLQLNYSKGRNQKILEDLPEEHRARAEKLFKEFKWI